MKKYLFIILILGLFSFCPDVPNTTTFRFSQVAMAVYGDSATGRNLVSAFTDAIGTFDPAYVGSKNNLLNFRNYHQCSYSGAGLTQGFNALLPITMTKDLYIGGSFQVAFIKTWNCGSWKTVVITGFNPDYDGDGLDIYTLKDGATTISSFPYSKDISSIIDGNPTGMTITNTMTTGPQIKQKCLITYYIINTDNFNTNTTSIQFSLEKQ